MYRPDKAKEAEKVMGADDIAHPSVAYLRNRAKDLYVGGSIQAIQLPTYHDYVSLRCECVPNGQVFEAGSYLTNAVTPSELRAHFKKMAWRKVVAFQVSASHIMVRLHDSNERRRRATQCTARIGN